MKFTTSTIAATVTTTMLLAPSVAAFQQPATPTKASKTSLSSSKPQTLDGWTPDSNKPCYGLPGAIAPLGFFDPFGFTDEKDLNGVKYFREAEITHGRVAMLAAVGYLLQENTPTIAQPWMNVQSASVVANKQMEVVPLQVLIPLFLSINLAEAFRATYGWEEPREGKFWTLRDTYYPGDLGFDPLGFTDGMSAEDFREMKNKELSNGRLAMIATIGFMVEELSTNMQVVDATIASGTGVN